MIPQSPISADSFAAFFEALWEFPPFPWQIAFAKRVCEGAAPDYVAVPTGSGKTACLDATVFALAVQASRPHSERNVGRRIFFIVNRRIIVDEAFDRANKLAQKLNASLTSNGAPGIVNQVAQWLRYLSGENGVSLSCTQLRGGIYRDRAWASSLTQPMIVCSTVDQAGSRLLFRGYGVSPEARPIHAALVGQDSFLLIDEAHISQPFLQTLDWVSRYRQHRPVGSETVALPFTIVRLTATPPRDESGMTRLALSEEDEKHPVLRPRLTCSKLAQLVPAPKAKGKKWTDELAEVIEKESLAIIKERSPRSILIMVNRVATARSVAKALTEKLEGKTVLAKVTLLLGRMRPLDRDQVTKELQAVLKTGAQSFAQADSGPVQIVVSTQCLEVGADFDFDCLVTECASHDALRQRFGRLNRAGRPIQARAVIILPEESAKGTDPIYGDAIPATWSWLQTLQGEAGVDFGLKSMTQAISTLRETNEGAFNRMLSPKANAPVLLPAYLDCWVQTNPGPAADPEVGLFLHGPHRDMAEVQICWRADLPPLTGEPSQADADRWAEALALCPPTNLECLPVPLVVLRQWLENDDAPDLSGDCPARTPEEEPSRRQPKARISALIWRGVGESRLVSWPREVRPGDTLVLRAQDGGWEKLGHIPKAAASKPASFYDLGEEGQAILRRHNVIRFHPELNSKVEKDSPAHQLWEWAKDENFNWRSSPVAETLNDLATKVGDETSLRAIQLRHLAVNVKKLEFDTYPDGSGFVFSVNLPLPGQIQSIASTEDGADDPLLETSEPQNLPDHTKQVVSMTSGYAAKLGLDSFSTALATGATLHDIGKADPRFQALLIGGDITAASAQPVLWAKSARIPSTARARQRARERASLPAGFRHEMLSVQLASTQEGLELLPKEKSRQSLTLHLIASHHGHARPFAPVVEDETPPSITYSASGPLLCLTADQRHSGPAHAVDSGLAERFWELNRCHGWWGLALLETTLRLSDQSASAHPSSPLP